MSKVVGFDLGYTLIYLERETSYREALQRFGIDRPMEQIEMAHHWADKYFMREFQGVLGRQSEHYFPWYAGLVNFYLNVSVPLFEFTRALQACRDRERPWKEYPWTHEVLDELKSQGCRLFLLSNWDHTARAVLDQHRLTPYFDEIVISSEVACQKPDPRIFELALKQIQASPSETIFVGDNYYDDCVGAATMGMSSLLINRFDRFGIEEIEDQTVIRDIRHVTHYVDREKSEVG